MKGKRQIFLLWAFIYFTLANGYSPYLFAQEGKSEGKLASMPDERCLKEFDIDKINIEDPRLVKYIPLLIEYFLCRATIKDEIGECNKLIIPKHIDECIWPLEDNELFFGRVIRKSGKGISEEISFCAQRWGRSKDECATFATAMLKGDVSVCANEKPSASKDCRAVIKADTGLCNSKGCFERVTYLKAVKNKNPGNCEAINSARLRSMCKAAISGDTDICETGSGFKDFRNKYCIEIYKREVGDGKGK